jgi:hypothetical protein
MASGAMVPGPADPPGEWADTSAGRGPLDGLQLAVHAERPVACRWEPVTGVVAPAAVPPDEGLAGLRRQIGALSPQAPAMAAGRYSTIVSCLAALGRPAGTPCTIDDGCDGGWIVVRAAVGTAASIAVASTLTSISGVPTPVAVAVGSRLAHPQLARAAHGPAGEDRAAPGGP